MTDFSNKTQKVAVITGASAGIGRATALEFARKGFNVVLAARRLHRLQEIAAQCEAFGGVKAIAAECDVSDCAQVEAVIERALSEFGRLDILVNNAGYGMFANVSDIDEAELRKIFDVNFYGLWYGHRAAAKIMTAQGFGHIFNVSSVIGKRATPMHGGYCSTKFAVCGLTEAARVELAPKGVCVTLVCPALTETEFFDRSSMEGRDNSKLKLAKYQKLMDPAKVARKIVKTAGKKKAELVFSAGGKFLVKLSALWPSLVDKMMEFYRRDLTGQ